jgi:rhomboid protease GluP
VIAFGRYLIAHARVTALIGLTCLVVFALEAVDAGSYDWLGGSGRGLSPALVLGVVYRPAIDAGEWWRLITAGFLHFGIIHLLLNLYALLFVGAALEPRYGSRRFAIIYGVALVGGNLAAYWLQSPRSISAGASGAIMGMFAAMAALGIRFPFRRDLLRSSLLPVVATLAYGFSNPSISNAAHVGGLISGFVAAWVVGVSPEWARLTKAQEQAALEQARRQQAQRIELGEPPASD